MGADVVGSNVTGANVIGLSVIGVFVIGSFVVLEEHRPAIDNPMAMAMAMAMLGLLAPENLRKTIPPW